MSSRAITPTERESQTALLLPLVAEAFNVITNSSVPLGEVNFYNAKKLPTEIDEKTSAQLLENIKDLDDSLKPALLTYIQTLAKHCTDTEIVASQTLNTVQLFCTKMAEVWAKNLGDLQKENSKMDIPKPLGKELAKVIVEGIQKSLEESVTAPRWVLEESGMKTKLKLNLPRGTARRSESGNELESSEYATALTELYEAFGFAIAEDIDVAAEKEAEASKRDVPKLLGLNANNGPKKLDVNRFVAAGIQSIAKILQSESTMPAEIEKQIKSLSKDKTCMKTLALIPIITAFQNAVNSKEFTDVFSGFHYWAVEGVRAEILKKVRNDMESVVKSITGERESSVYEALIQWAQISGEGEKAHLIEEWNRRIKYREENPDAVRRVGNANAQAANGEAQAVPLFCIQDTFIKTGEELYQELVQDGVMQRREYMVAKAGNGGAVFTPLDTRSEMDKVGLVMTVGKLYKHAITHDLPLAIPEEVAAVLPARLAAGVRARTVKLPEWCFPFKN